jgi:hypothetical protein
MKPMRYICCTLLIYFISIFNVLAQLKGFSIGAYLEAGKPTAGFDDTHGRGIGAGLNADIKLPAKLGLSGSVGFMRFNGTTKMTSINAMPMRVGLKYRLPIFYAKLESGIAKLFDNRESVFILSPGIGVRFLGLDIQGKFETWTQNKTWNFWGLKVGYNF